jgi:dolichol-phosphate mannosyltransferase
MKAIVITPTYNEKENVQKLIEILEKDVFPKIKDHETGILVADDNSPDGTSDAVKDLMKKYKNLHINSGPKHGLGAAYIRAMQYAIDELKADILIQIDADLQHDPYKLPLFLKKIDEGCDMVIGNRYSDGGSIPKNWPLKRKLFSITANLFVRTLFLKFQIHDWTGGYRALKKEVFLKEKQELTNFKGYIFQISFLQKAVRDKFKICEVPFHFSDRTMGDSKIVPLKYIFDVFKFVMVTRIKELATGSFGKFLVVGGIGFAINAVILRVLVENFGWHPSPANLAGAVVAIFSNYNFNNLWTFKKHRVKNVSSYFIKMGQFYATSAFGVIVIQTGTIYVMDYFFGRENYFLYFLIGTGFLLIWNFTIYNRFIWRTHK